MATPPSFIAANGGKAGTITLQIDVPSDGQLDVSATATVSGAAKTITYSKLRKAVKKGVVKLTLKPTAAARRLLKRKKHLRVKVRAKFAPAGGGNATVLIKSATVKARR